MLLGLIFLRTRWFDFILNSVSKLLSFFRFEKYSDNLQRNYLYKMIFYKKSLQKDHKKKNGLKKACFLQECFWMK